jgi:hypothetical protein
VTFNPGKRRKWARLLVTRYGDRRDADGMAVLLGLTAVLDEPASPLAVVPPGGGLEAVDDVDKGIRVEKIDHSGHS